MSFESISANDDGLPTPEVGRWALDKYSLMGLYAKLFSTGMKWKWDQRVYLDLYSGSGYGRMRGTSRIVLGSPLIALTLPDRFDKYIFCEQKEDLLSALKTRCTVLAPEVRPVFILGGCNEMVSQILSEIPIGSSSRTVLTLCFVDPYNLVGVNFEMLKQLSARYVDFLCLLALHMDANRNYERYVTEDAPQVDRFLGYTAWREKWRKAQWQAIDFPDFLAAEFSERMTTLGYMQTPPYLMKRVRSDEKNLPLYHLALFSRNKTAFEFWDEVLKYSTDQQSLF